jgi:8-oxo-dGTP pyrophosphatase MutT (NUDIX family)
MTRIVEKVTAFIIRKSKLGPELLLFEHPYAGIQIPAGTVEEGESPETAVLREAEEETGLNDLSLGRYLGSHTEQLLEEQRIIAETTRFYARPDQASRSWAYLGKGIMVTRLRQAEEFSQICYEEFDREPEPQYVSLSITGWVPDAVLADTRRRHFFRLEFQGQTAERWTVYSDNHRFSLFWAPLGALPEIISPQAAWLAFLRMDESGDTRVWEYGSEEKG